MKPTILFLAALALAAVAGCAAPIPPRNSEPPREMSPPPEAGVNKPSNVETTSSEYDTPSSSTGSSR
jgi:hypothetical protein